ncbi:MAG: hypothetical protein RIC55_09210 [Pirellulaceae bacterium]
MIRRLLSFAIPMAALLSGDALRGDEWGDLTGRFVYDGAPPIRKLIPLSKEAVCLTRPVVDESLVVGASGGVENIVVYVRVAPGEDPPPVHPSYVMHAEDKVELREKDCRFEPRVVLLRTSQSLVTRSFDDFGHIPRIDGFRNVQVGAVIPAGNTQTHAFPLEEPVPAPVSCSVHPWMQAWLLVRDSPYFAVTDERGKFTIRNLPAGEWTFQFWHEKAGYLQQVTIDGAERQWRKGRVRLTIEAGENDLGTIRLRPEVFQ